MFQFITILLYFHPHMHHILHNPIQSKAGDHEKRHFDPIHWHCHHMITMLALNTYCAVPVYSVSRCYSSWRSSRVPGRRIGGCLVENLKSKHKQFEKQPLPAPLISPSEATVQLVQVPHPCRSATPTRTRHRWLPLHLLPRRSHCLPHAWNLLEPQRW